MAKHRHNLSHTRLLTGDMGKVYPAGLIEVLPGDRFRHNASLMVRLSPMAAPVMHNMTVRIHHFFVPHRLAWPEGQEGVADTFEDFITGGPDGTESNPLPTVETTGAPKDLFDYLGLPVLPGIAVNSLPLRGLNLIHREWYRDQDLVTERDLEDPTVFRCAWEKDYFSTSRPWPQKGPEVTLPLGGDAPVRTSATQNQAVTVENGDGDNYWLGTTDGSGQLVRGQTTQTGAKLVTDLSAATAATINALRRASGLQRFAEARARYGSRYAEYVRHAFGARPLDSRLQRPEYLGGGTQQVSVSEILQTAPDATQSPGDERFGVGDLYGHGIALTRSNRYTVRFQEHGYVHTLISIRPKAVYANGIDRTFLRRDREDFYQRELAHIGQQQVLTQEVFATADNSGEVFGWSDRYAEYRTTNNRVTGEFRDVLDYWHLARKFETAPALNATFVECDPDKRVFNVTDESVDALWMLASHQVQALRVVPRNAVARLL